jgi:ATP-dependent Clp protease ATP-binding subunit ClpB
VDFKNTIIILTSNLGSQFLLDGIDANGNISKTAQDQVNALLRQSFRPEFLNRLDEIVMYKPLTKDDVTKIADLQLAGLDKRLADKGLGVIVTQEAKQFIIDSSYDPLFGARPMKRFIQDNVETLIARTMLEHDDLDMGDCLRICMKDGDLAVEIEKAAIKPDEITE